MHNIHIIKCKKKAKINIKMIKSELIKDNLTMF